MLNFRWIICISDGKHNLFEYVESWLVSTAKSWQQLMQMLKMKKEGDKFQINYPSKLTISNANGWCKYFQCWLTIELEPTNVQNNTFICCNPKAKFPQPFISLSSLQSLQWHFCCYWGHGQWLYIWLWPSICLQKLFIFEMQMWMWWINLLI